MIPVEPVSLTIGAVALASLFSLCVECFDLIEVGRNLGSDYDILILKLSIEKRRLMIWGEAVGVLRPDANRDPLLDDADTRKLVERILESIQKLFTDADGVASKYGLQKSTKTQGAETSSIIGSSVCIEAFQSSAIVQFHSRLVEHQSKAGLRSRTRWAIRDNKKFSAMVQNLKELIDGLGEISISTNANVLRGHLIRQETESIPDLQTLKIIESTCSDSDWRTSATLASEYLGDKNRLTPTGRENIYNWMEDQKIDKLRSSDGAFAGEITGEAERLRPPKLRSMNHPYEADFTQVFVVCNATSLIAYLPPTRASFHPAEAAPIITEENQTTASRILKAVNAPSTIQLPCITIYCPPRMHFVHLALALVNPEEESRFRFHVRFDERLLDQPIPNPRERLQGYYDDIWGARHTTDPAVKRTVDAIDINWLQQRIEALNPAVRPSSELDMYTIFRQSRDDIPCAAIIVMTGELRCRTLFRSPPVLPADISYLAGRIFRLRELDEADSNLEFRWKAEHYCNITETPANEKMKRMQFVPLR